MSAESKGGLTRWERVGLWWRGELLRWDRLQEEIAIVRAELECSPVCPDCRPQMVSLLEKAAQAKRANEGWKCLNAARRILLRSAPLERLRTQAIRLMNESRSKSKDMSDWRRKTIEDLLLTDAGKLKEKPEREAVLAAAAIADESFDNVYLKLGIILRALRWMAIAGTLLQILLIGKAPDFHLYQSICQSRLDLRDAAFAIAIAGAAGAVASGLTRTKGISPARIPFQVVESWLMGARLVLGSISATAVVFFFDAGLLSVLPATWSVALVVAFSAGFSKRILVSAVESLKP